jgi:hypothetical protein
VQQNVTNEAVLSLRKCEFLQQAGFPLERGKPKRLGVANAGLAAGCQVQQGGQLRLEEGCVKDRNTIPNGLVCDGEMVCLKLGDI